MICHYGKRDVRNLNRSCLTPVSGLTSGRSYICLEKAEGREFLLRDSAQAHLGYLCHPQSHLENLLMNRSDPSLLQKLRVSIIIEIV